MPPPDKDSRSTDEQMVAHLATINRSLKWLPLKAAIYCAVVIVVVELVLIALTSGVNHRTEMRDGLKAMQGIKAR